MYRYSSGRWYACSVVVPGIIVPERPVDFRYVLMSVAKSRVG